MPSRLAAYEAAARRHLRDAVALSDDRSVDRRMNADHLLGFAWECALKEVSRALGMPMTADGAMPKERDDRVHADQAFRRFQVHAATRSGGLYAGVLAGRARDPDPFADWSVSDRYAPDEARPKRKRIAERRAAVMRALRLVERARLDGWLG